MSRTGMRRIFIPKVTVSIFLAFLCAFFSCGGGTIVEKVESEYKKGNYREAAFLVRHHLHRGGDRNPELLFLAARSLLEIGVEGEANDYFAEIYSADSSWAPEIATALREKALEYMEEGGTTQGKRLMVQAAGYDPALTFGEYDLDLGKALMEAGDYRNAVRFFKSYINLYADSSGASEAVLNLAAAYEECGETSDALETYQLLSEKYPKSRFVSTARWNFENLSLEEAESLMEKGKVEEATNILVRVSDSKSSTLIRVQANFMLGEIYREEGLADKALGCYRAVLKLSLGSSGRYAEKAKERIEELEETK